MLMIGRLCWRRLGEFTYCARDARRRSRSTRTCRADGSAGRGRRDRRRAVLGRSGRGLVGLRRSAAAFDWTTWTASMSSWNGATLRTQTRLLNRAAWCAGTPTSTTSCTLRRPACPWCHPVRGTGCGSGDRTRAFLRGGPGGCTVGGAHAFDEFVVKPAIGAGSRDAARYARSEASAALQHLERLIGAGRSVMLQPYLARVDAQGETAALYWAAGQPRDRKGPLLRRGAGLVEGLFAPEDIRPRKPRRPSCPSPPRLCGDPFEAPAYARIDLIRDDTDAPSCSNSS